MWPINKHFVLFVASDPAACRDFYVEHFGFQVEVDIGWYVVLTSGSERPMGLGFLQADHPTQLAQHRSPTAGSRFITFEVDEVGPIAERLMAAGLDVDVPLRDEPWGQRHLIVRDPGGNCVDIVQNIAPDRAFARRWFKMAV
ncbi:MAG TPA: VOC family protein [Desertimonas sp.]|nr:VOC family protein [Desertimonas sp.]